MHKIFHLFDRIMGVLVVLLRYKKSNRLYHVGKNQKYKTIKEGISEATKYLNSTVLVEDGIYDLFEEFGEDYFNKIDETYSNCTGIVLKNNVHVIFSNNSKVIFNYRGNNKYVKTKFSPFNAGDLGFTLENATIECSNSRYCVHDEMYGSLFPYKNKYINCYMYMDNSENVEWNTFQCIGGGLGIRGNILIANSKFYTKADNIYPAVSWHNRGGVIRTNCMITISNCEFMGKNTFRLNSYGKHSDTTHAILLRNKLGSKVINGKTTVDSTVNTKIIEIDNDVNSAG
jgi:hypothetical protein